MWDFRKSEIEKRVILKKFPKIGNQKEVQKCRNLQLKEARIKAEITQDDAAALMKITRRAISEMEAGKRSISADELAQFSRIYNVDVRELLFVEFTEAGDEQRLTAKYSSFLKLLEKLSDREVEDVYWVIKRKVEGLL